LHSDLNFRKSRWFLKLKSRGPIAMNTAASTPLIPDDIQAQLQETLDDLVKGIRNPDKMKAACERMDRMREENRKLFGEHGIAVDLIRETRDYP
jgi:succinate dehydrogenase/fumarate reductase flavoprotein subunit